MDESIQLGKLIQNCHLLPEPKFHRNLFAVDSIHTYIFVLSFFFWFSEYDRFLCALKLFRNIPSNLL